MTIPAVPPTNSLASASLVLAFLVPPLGIVLGNLAREEIGASGQPGYGLATAGMVIGCILTALILLLPIIALAAYVLLSLLYSGFIPLY